MAQKIRPAPLFVRHEVELELLARSVMDTFVGNSGDTDSVEVYATVTVTAWATGSPTHVVVRNVDLDDDESRITYAIAIACNGLDEDVDYTVTVTLEDREASHDPVAASVDIFGDDTLHDAAEEQLDEENEAVAQA